MDEAEDIWNYALAPTLTVTTTFMCPVAKDQLASTIYTPDYDRKLFEDMGIGKLDIIKEYKDEDTGNPAGTFCDVEIYMGWFECLKWITVPIIGNTGFKYRTCSKKSEGGMKITTKTVSFKELAIESSEIEIGESTDGLTKVEVTTRVQINVPGSYWIADKLTQIPVDMFRSMLVHACLHIMGKETKYEDVKQCIEMVRYNIATE